MHIPGLNKIVDVFWSWQNIFVSRDTIFFTDQRKTEWTPAFYLEEFWWCELLVTNINAQLDKHTVNIEKKTWIFSATYLDFNWSLCCILNTNQVFLKSDHADDMWKGIWGKTNKYFFQRHRMYVILPML